MEFLRPSFLWALFLIAIPIIIHLFYFRRYKKEYFSNVRFLKHVQEEQSTWRRLRNLLVLLARILAVAFIVFAFAQPFIPSNEQTNRGRKAVSIYIDNSFSMNSRNEDVPLLNKARQKALEIVRAQDFETEIQIVSNTRTPASSRWLNQEQAIQAINEIKIGPESRMIKDVLQQQKRSFQRADGQDFLRFIISDFQKSTSEISAIEDSLIATYFIPLSAVQTANVAIDSVVLDAPLAVKGQRLQLFVRISNFDRQSDHRIRLSIQVDGETRPFGQRDIPAGATIWDTVQITSQTTGWKQAIVQISDYPVQFDDRYLLSFYVPEALPILTIYEDQANPFLKSALNAIDIVSATAEPKSQLNYAAFSTYNLIILEELKSMSSGLQTALMDYIQAGGNVLLFPPSDFTPNDDQNWWNRLNMKGISSMKNETAQVFSIEEESFLFQDVYQRQDQRRILPKVSAYMEWQGGGEAAQQVIMRFRNGKAFLSQLNVSSGQFLLCHAPLDMDYNNLVNVGEVFVPLVFRAALLSAQSVSPSLIIGRDQGIQVKKTIGVGEADYKINGPRNFIPLQRSAGAQMLIDFQGQIRESGFYNLNEKDSLLRTLAFNYDRKESDLATWSLPDIKQKVDETVKILDIPPSRDAGQYIEQAVSGRELWKWCIILSLLFLAAEQLLLRLWKTE
jgi:hypothetical protein